MRPSIHVSRNQTIIGVFTEDQIRASLAQGSLTRSDYCWTEGMREWKPIGDAYPHLLAGMKAGDIGATQPAAATYAGGGERFGAYLLDGLFMTLMTCGLCSPFFLMLSVGMAEASSESEVNAFGAMIQLLVLLVGMVVTLLYYGIQGNSSENATWGQRIMGFKMVDARTGAAPSSGQVWKWSAFRCLILSCCSCIGWLLFIPILYHARKQSVFDQWSDILMVRK